MEGASCHTSRRDGEGAEGRAPSCEAVLAGLPRARDVRLGAAGLGRGASERVPEQARAALTRLVLVGSRLHAFPIGVIESPSTRAASARSKERANMPIISNVTSPFTVKESHAPTSHGLP